MHHIMDSLSKNDAYKAYKKNLRREEDVNCGCGVAVAVCVLFYKLLLDSKVE